MALDEATASLLVQMAQARPKPLYEMSPREAREFLDSTRPEYEDRPAMARIENHADEVTGGQIPVRVLDPGGDPKGVIVYYHGGGWVVGAAGSRSSSPGTAPAATWPPSWALKARETGECPIVLQILIYPVTDCDFGTAAYRYPENALVLMRESMVGFWDHYAPEPAGRLHPHASPLRAPDLSGLPPAVVLTAEHDVLRTEGDSYTDRLSKSGAPVRHQCLVGQMHGFLTMLDLLPGSDAGLRYIVLAVQEHWAPSKPLLEIT